MAARKKSRLERWLSFNQHRKRFGAGKAAASLQEANFAALKERMITGDAPDYTHGADKDISQHLLNLRAEFAGQSELLYFHAQLIVMIRREYRAADHFRQFEHLWEEESDFLCQQLNTRWLVSAADTFADHATAPLARALALNASLLANTIKMQETERYLQQADTLSNQPERLNLLQAGRVPLFDGMSAFAVGTDDTLRNMRWRMDEISTLHPCGAILREIFQRLQEHDTVYRRIRLLHTRPKTAWW